MRCTPVATFESKIKKFAAAAVKKAKHTRIDAIEDLTTSIIRDTPVDTGEAKHGWNKKGVTSGEDGTFTFVNSVEHTVYLELGHSKQAPKGMVRINAQRVMNKLR